MKSRFRATAVPCSDGSSRRLVVIEQGADALGSRLSPDGGDETIVVVQGVDETPLQLLFRVIRRLALLERSAHRVRRAELVVAPRLDAQSTAARGVVARALLAHLVAGGEGELLVAGEGPHAGLQGELLTLVDALAAEDDEGTVMIRLELNGRQPRVPPESGVYRAVSLPGAPFGGEVSRPRASGRRAT